ncbi:hypothetical protein D3C86_1642050 [compost metagenome]
MMTIGLIAFGLQGLAMLLFVVMQVRSDVLRHRGIGPAKRLWSKGWNPLNIPALGFIYSEDHRSFGSRSITCSVWMLRVLLPLLAASCATFFWLSL